MAEIVGFEPEVTGFEPEDDDYLPKDIQNSWLTGTKLQDTLTLGGTKKIRQGMGALKRGKYLKAGNDFFEGATQAVAGPAVAAAVGIGGTSVIPSLAGSVAAGTAVDYGIRTIGKKLGFDEEKTRAVANVTGAMIPVVGTGRKLYKAYKGLVDGPTANPKPKVDDVQSAAPKPDVTVTSEPEVVGFDPDPGFQLTAPDNSHMRGLHQKKLYKQYPDKPKLAGEWKVPEEQIGATPLEPQPMGKQAGMFDQQTPKLEGVSTPEIPKNPEINYFNQLNEFQRSPEFQQLTPRDQRRVVISQRKIRKELAPEELALARERATQAALETKVADRLPDYQPDSPASASAVKNFYKSIESVTSLLKRKVVDRFVGIEDLLAKAQRNNPDRELLPSEDIRNRYDDALRYQKISLKLMEASGFNKLVQALPEEIDIPKAGDYLIARHLTTLSDNGENVGYGWDGFKRNYHVDKQLVAEGNEKYGAWAEEATKVANRVMMYAMKEGLVSPEYVAKMREKYPDYITLHQMFDSDGKLRDVGRLTPLASMPKQNVYKDRVLGGEGDFQNPLITLATRMELVTRDALRNRVAKQLAEYGGAGDPNKAFPEFQALIKEVKEVRGETDSPLQFSFMDGGKRRVFETTPEIANAAKGMEAERLGAFGEWVRVFYRAAQMGFTAFNPAFVATNLTRDLGTAVNLTPGRVTATLKALPNAVVETLMKNSPQYKELEMRGAVGSFFDQLKSQGEYTEKSLGRIQSMRDPKEHAKHVVKNPKEWVSIIENLMGTGEEINRTAQWNAAFKEAVAGGMAETEAKILADKASRKTTTDFYRKGEFGAVFNSMFPYVNAGIQGSRTTLRFVKDNPGKAAVRIGTSILLPTAAATAWNLKDPKRRDAYMKLDSSVREKNIVLMGPNPEIDNNKDSENYGRFKIGSVFLFPLPPGINNLAGLVRRPIEDAYAVDPVKFGDLATDIIKVATPFGPDSNELISSFTPQFIRPAAEVQANRNFYTDKPIVRNPTAPKSEQVDKKTSLASKAIASGINAATGNHPAPANVEHLLSGYMGPNATKLPQVFVDPIDTFDEVVTKPIRNRYLTPFAAGEIERKRKLKLEKLNK